MDGLLRSILDAVPPSQGFLFDGYPRNLHQAEVLDGLLAERGRPLTAVLALQLPDTEIVHRLGGRRCARAPASRGRCTSTTPPRWRAARHRAARCSSATTIDRRWSRSASPSITPDRAAAGSLSRGRPALRPRRDRCSGGRGGACDRARLARSVAGPGRDTPDRRQRSTQRFAVGGGDDAAADLRHDALDAPTDDQAEVTAAVAPPRRDRTRRGA